jgi:hypothetical protein
MLPNYCNYDKRVKRICQLPYFLGRPIYWNQYGPIKKAIDLRLNGDISDSTSSNLFAKIVTVLLGIFEPKDLEDDALADSGLRGQIV